MRQNFRKMKPVENVIICVIIALCLAQTVWSIKCWDCRSDNDPKCADPFDNSTLVITDCSQEPDLTHLPGARPTMCRKIRQKVHGEWRYFRSCAFMGEPGIEGDERFCLMRTGSYNIFMEFCTCNSKDGCNSAGLLKGSQVTIGITTLFISTIAWFLKQ